MTAFSFQNFRHFLRALVAMATQYSLLLQALLGEFTTPLPVAMQFERCASLLPGPLTRRICAAFQPIPTATLLTMPP